MMVLFEVVTGQIKLSRRRDFFDLHSQTLLPIMKEVGIVPHLLLLTEVGRYCRFLDIYRYESMVDYEEKTSRLLRHPAIEDYYARVGDCVEGGIHIELMRHLPYAQEWER